MNFNPYPLLYPRIPPSAAMRRVLRIADMKPEDLVALSATTYEGVIYAPIGGNRAGESHLRELQFRMRNLAAASGYPGPPNDNARRTFDAASGRLLHETMAITPVEASSPGVWAFLGCVLLPDIVRWRFPGGERTTDERFLGRSRGLRNTFGRVWWRAYVLNLPADASPYRLLEKLGEDELVQIMERPNLSASPVLAKQIALSFLDTLPRFPGASRADVLRDAMKRFRRLYNVVSLDALTGPELKAVIDSVLDQSGMAITGRRAGSVADNPVTGANDGNVSMPHAVLQPPSPGISPAAMTVGTAADDTGGTGTAENSGSASPDSDPLPASLASHVPAQSWTCNLCGTNRRLWITKNGPRVQCEDSACRAYVAVSAATIAAALDELHIRCPSCRSPMHGKPGDGLIRCTRYPECGTFWLWQRLREVLRQDAASS